jgi:hypothetical protein
MSELRNGTACALPSVIAGLGEVPERSVIKALVSLFALAAAHEEGSDHEYQHGRRHCLFLKIHAIALFSLSDARVPTHALCLVRSAND